MSLANGQGDKLNGVSRVTPQMAPCRRPRNEVGLGVVHASGTNSIFQEMIARLVMRFGAASAGGALSAGSQWQLRNGSRNAALP